MEYARDPPFLRQCPHLLPACLRFLIAGGLLGIEFGDVGAAMKESPVSGLGSSIEDDPLCESLPYRANRTEAGSSFWQPEVVEAAVTV